MIDLPNLSQYQVLSEAEQEALCVEIRAEIASGKFKPAGEPSRRHWEDVWSISDPTKVPPYVRSVEILRIGQHFYRSSKRNQELYWYKRFRQNLLKKYFNHAPALYEFGCGNGWNLMAAHDLYPGTKVIGLDWATSAVERINKMGPYWHGERITARQFDFFDPDYELKLMPGAAVWTVGALEQTGDNYYPFLEYLLANKPAICVHVEPILEWYDPENPVDQTAIAYHRARKYWEGFPAELAHLAAQGKAEIIHQQRSFFGSKYLEGYSLLVWRPT